MAQESEDPTPTPTPQPTDCVTLPPEMQDSTELYEGQIDKDGIKYQCWVVTTTPTPKYEALGKFTYLVQRAEEATSNGEAGGASGASREASASATDSQISEVFVMLHFNSEEATSAAADWIRERRAEGDESTFIVHPAYLSIAVEVPVTWLVALSELEGFAHVEEAPIPTINAP